MLHSAGAQWLGREVALVGLNAEKSCQVEVEPMHDLINSYYCLVVFRLFLLKIHYFMGCTGRAALLELDNRGR